MRQIGIVSNPDLARQFADYLRANGTACTVDQNPEGFRLWVHDDDKVDSARAELPLYLADPGHERYRDASKLVIQQIREDAARLKIARSRTVNMSERWDRSPSQSCPLTYILIAISVAVGLACQLTPRVTDPVLGRLWFSDDGTFRAILNGEVWRLITPIFLHFGMMHLLFNMLWLRQFGMQIEYRLGSAKFLMIVLVSALVSNLAEFLFGSPFFGGMSGVVYGLFGYIWVRGKLEPNSGFWLPQQTILMMLVWHVLCMAGIVANVANWAHGGGLVTGIALAFGGQMVKSLTRRK